MAAPKRPRRGSLAFYPRKRAKRIYPMVRDRATSDKKKFLEFSGYKAGMTSIRILDIRKTSTTKGEEIRVPATIIECPPIKIIGIRFYSQTPYGLKVMTDVLDANLKKDKDIARKLKVGEYRTNEKLSYAEKHLDKIKDISLIVRTQPKLTGLGKKKPEVFEIDIGGNDIKEKMNFAKEIFGKEVKITDVFKEGEYVDIIAITKGKGTQGVVKRFGVKIQNRKDMKHHRQIGALGPQSPGRVRWTVPRAGQMGFSQRTEYNKRILKIGQDTKEINPSGGITNYGIIRNSYILLEGSIPGPRKRLVMLRTAIRPPKTAFLPAEIKEITK